MHQGGLALESPSQLHSRYRVTNWAKYDNRGSLTVWLSPDALLDATGLKVFGQGEWARAKHGSHGAPAGWRKLHLGIDGDDFIVTTDLSDSDVADATAFPGLVRKVKS